jgi:hypothetical protein
MDKPFYLALFLIVIWIALWLAFGPFFLEGRP